jgi:hypothetical protein
MTKEPVSMNEELREADSDHVWGRLSHGKTARAGSGGAILKKRALEPIDAPRKGDEKNKGAQGSGEEQRDA